MTEQVTTGKVYLVGAGPGDPGLITLRGIQCLRAADVVLYDYLVNPVIVRHAPDTAELVCLGRHGGHHRIWSQDEINRRLVQLAVSGRTVVRLKGGDPAVFARGGEEAEFLRQHSIDLEIVPGITAALAAGSHAGIPITHRDLASAVAFVTGQEKPGKEPFLDYEALAKFPGTLVFYMGVTSAKRWTKELMDHGMPPTTSAAIVRRCSLPDQFVLRCRLDEVADQLTPYSRISPPVVVIVGDVAQAELAIDWFPQRPLFGQTILVTRPLAQAQELAALLEAQGARTIIQPAIQIKPVEDWAAVDEILRRLADFDGLVFSSVNGVENFLGRLWETGRDLRALANLRLAAIGSATAARLATYHLRADVVPDEFRAEELANELIQSSGSSKFLLVRANRGRETLADELRAADCAVEQVVVYNSLNETELAVESRELLEARKVDWVTVTSSAIARSLRQLLGNQMSELQLASISPITSATLRELGLEPTVEATDYTMRGVVEAILKKAGQ